MKLNAERDYSGRSLFQKLGVVSKAHIALVGRHDPTFVAALNARLAKAASQTLRTTYDMIFVRVDAPLDLPWLSRAAARLKRSGALWVFHPKGRGASPTDAQVRSYAIGAGLVDNKISAYSDTHTATRYVIPLTRRSSV